MINVQQFQLDITQQPLTHLKVVNGDTANQFVIKITNDGDSVSLDSTLHKIVAVFHRADGQVYTQDADSGVTFTTAGVVTVDVLPSSFRTGTNTITLQIYKRLSSSDELYPLLATTNSAAFYARASAIPNETPSAQNPYPSLEKYVAEAASYAHGGTGVRTGENTDNAKFWSELSKTVALPDGVVTNEKLSGGSVSEDKIETALSLKIIKDYVTPQMFGAVGNGINDDTQAFLNMFASNNKNILIPSGEYKITSSIVIPNGVTMLGCGDSTTLKRYTTDLSATDFLLVGGETKIGCFNIEVASQNSVAFQGSCIKINETSLAEYNHAELRSTIHDISALIRASIGNNVSAIELSLQNTFGNNRYGFCNLAISNYNVRCASGIILDYYCRVFSTNSNYWITGITFDGGFINNCKWGFFPMYSDYNLLDESTYSGRFTAICNSVQMQAQTGTKGFLYMPYNKSVKISLVGCIPWDFSTKNTYPFYFDYRRITEKQNIANDYMETDGSVGYSNFVGVTTGNVLVDMNAYNLGHILNYVGKRDISLGTVAALTPKLFYVPHSAKAVKLYSKTISSGRRTIVFKYLSASEGKTWATVTINWIVGSAPTMAIEGGTSSIKFGYIITQNESMYTLDVYAVRSNSGSLMYVCFESLPFSNSQLAYDNSGQASSYLATINLNEFTSDEVYLASIPSGITYLEDVNTVPILIAGTDENDAKKLYKLSVINGMLTVSETKYWNM